MKIEDLTGRVFTRWIVIRFNGRNQKNLRMWLCKCLCGKMRAISEDTLRSRHSQSCGCLRVDVATARVFKHGLSHTPIWNIWRAMNRRCNNPSDKSFCNYGGRGIKVCESWLKFENFFKDMGHRPSGLTLERIDNNKGYSPDNCKWATRKENIVNRRVTVFMTLNGRTMCQADWCRELSINSQTLRARRMKGWSDNQCLTTPT